MRLHIDGQWLHGVRRVPSPNSDERPAGTDIDLIVVHAISLPPGEYGGPYIDRLFCNSLDSGAHPYFAEVAGLKVSAHVLIDRHGKLTQYVAFDERAWHAGESVHCGRRGCNDYSIGIELEGCDDEPYTQSQYTSLVALTRVLMARWPAITAERIVGHCDVAPGRKTDPGPAFDWEHFRELIG